jgi:hypothetical protein
MAEVNCTGGCSCVSSRGGPKWKGRSSLHNGHVDAGAQRVSIATPLGLFVRGAGEPRRVPLAASERDKPCYLLVRTLPGTLSDGHKVKVTALMSKGWTKRTKPTRPARRIKR